MAKHTHGPWICYADTPSIDPNWHIVTTENRQRIVANVHIEPGSEMDAANAHLITAAPDLLEMAKWAESAIAPFSKEPAENSGITRLRAAIAKAEGRS